MDELIQAVVRAMQKGRTIEAIHNAIVKKGWAEDDAFLALKAGENLHLAILQQERGLATKPPPFGRKPQ